MEELAMKRFLFLILFLFIISSFINATENQNLVEGIFAAETYLTMEQILKTQDNIFTPLVISTNKAVLAGLKEPVVANKNKLHSYINHYYKTLWEQMMVDPSSREIIDWQQNRIYYMMNLVMHHRALKVLNSNEAMARLRSTKKPDMVTGFYGIAGVCGSSDSIDKAKLAYENREKANINSAVQNNLLNLKQSLEDLKYLSQYSQPEQKNGEEDLMFCLEMNIELHKEVLKISLK
jgi:hypothetical protein